MLRFTTRDLLWLMVLVGMAAALWVDRRSLGRLEAAQEQRAGSLQSEREVNDALREIAGRETQVASS